MLINNDISKYNKNSLSIENTYNRSENSVSNNKFNNIKDNILNNNDKISNNIGSIERVNKDENEYVTKRDDSIMKKLIRLENMADEILGRDNIEDGKITEIKDYLMKEFEELKKSTSRNGNSTKDFDKFENT